MNADQAYAILEQVDDFLEDHSDVKDGNEGRSVPNTAMRLSQDLKEVLKWLETL